MAVTSYATFNGNIVYENRAGVERDYMRDSLGSTTALLDSSQAQTDTFFYWPYGEIRTQTGSTKTPFTFVGTLGYYMDIASSLFYVRARHLRSVLARWLTVDPMWSAGAAYGYVGNNPTCLADPSGLQPGGPGGPGDGSNQAHCKELWKDCDKKVDSWLHLAILLITAVGTGACLGAVFLLAGLVATIPIIGPGLAVLILLFGIAACLIESFLVLEIILAICGFVKLFWCCMDIYLPCMKIPPAQIKRCPSIWCGF